MTLISVILLTFQRPRRLWQAMESVGLQVHPDVEVIVVNNGGVPIEPIIDRYWQEFKRPVQLVTLRTGESLSTARNAGIAIAQGEIIALLDDDDRYRPTHLSSLMDVLEREPDAVLAYDDALLLLEKSSSADDLPDVIATCRLGFPYEKERFEENDYIPPSALAMRRTAFYASGSFDRSLDHVEDWDLLLRLRDQGALRYVPGDIGIEYSLRIGVGDNKGSTFDQSRRDCLNLLTTRYNLPPLVPKTFCDVARDLGCVVVPLMKEDGTLLESRD